MKLKTQSTALGIETYSEENVNVLHSVKKTYKGAKIARVQNLTDIIQGNAIDNKIKWAKHKEQRKLERKQRQESI